MSDPSPEYHSNPQTFKAEPVFLFTDKAIVPVKKGDPPSALGGEEKAPPSEQPGEGVQN